MVVVMVEMLDVMWVDYSVEMLGINLAEMKVVM
jgi:hypothetical protein